MNRGYAVYFLILFYNMDVITIGGKKYHSIDKFKLIHNINSDKTCYNWVDKGKAELKKMFNKSFFRLKD